MKVELSSSDPGQVMLQVALDRVRAEGNLTVPGNDPKGLGV
jgi:hypothetical protein